MNNVGIAIVSILVFILVVVLAGLIYVYSGAYNVAANDQHFGPVRWLLETTSRQSIATHADDLAPVELPSDSASISAGFIAYEQMCVQCHGAPGLERGWIGKGVKPTPPRLDEEASEFTQAELYWVLRHGIKYTAMPALEPTHSDEQIKEIAAFVHELPSIDRDEYQRRRRMASAAAADSSAESDSSSGAGGHVHADGHDHTH